MDWALFLELISHTLPIIITLLFLLIVAALYVGAPYCRYIYHLTIPSSEEGNESLAKYLAKKTGGRGINVDDNWQSFLPAAKNLRESHLSRKNSNP